MKTRYAIIATTAFIMLLAVRHAARSTEPHGNTIRTTGLAVCRGELLGQTFCPQVASDGARNIARASFGRLLGTLVGDQKNLRPTSEGIRSRGERASEAVDLCAQNASFPTVQAGSDLLQELVIARYVWRPGRGQHDYSDGLVGVHLEGEYVIGARGRHRANESPLPGGESSLFVEQHLVAHHGSRRSARLPIESRYRSHVAPRLLHSRRIVGGRSVLLARSEGHHCQEHRSSSSFHGAGIVRARWQMVKGAA